MTIANALAPVLTLIVAGFLIRRSGFLAPTFWPCAEKLTYFLLMPAALIHALAGKKIGELPWKEILLTVEGSVLASAVIVTAWGMANRRMGGAVFTSLFQGGVRFNSFVALALSESLFGSEGLFLAALATGFMIVLINVLCVSAFSIAVASRSRAGLMRLGSDLCRNPLIIGCVAGIALNLSGLMLPAAVGGTLALAGKAAFPVGLMAVGAAYRAGNLARHREALLVSCAVQFLLKPLTAWYLAAATGLSGVAAAVAVLLFSVPTAPSAYILSRQMGGDHDSMAAIITAQTTLSFLTLPVTMWILLG